MLKSGISVQNSVGGGSSVIPDPLDINQINLIAPASDTYRLVNSAGAFSLSNSTDSRNILSCTAAGAMVLGSAVAGSSLAYNVATGQLHTFQVNGATVLTLSPTRLTFNNPSVDTWIQFDFSGAMALNATVIQANAKLEVQGDGADLITFASGGSFYDYSNTWISFSGSGVPDDGTNFYIPYNSASDWYIGFGMGGSEAIRFGITGSEFVVYGDGGIDVSDYIKFLNSSTASAGGNQPNAAAADGWINIQLDDNTVVAVPWYAI